MTIYEYYHLINSEITESKPFRITRFESSAMDTGETRDTSRRVRLLGLVYASSMGYGTLSERAKRTLKVSLSQKRFHTHNLFLQCFLCFYQGTTNSR